MNDENGKKKGRAARHVFTVVDRGGKSYWIRIGAAFGNYDGSETVLLDALPINGKMQIRVPVSREQALKAKTAAEPVNEDGD